MEQEAERQTTTVKVSEFFINDTHKVEHFIQRAGASQVVDRYYPQFKRLDGWHYYQDTVAAPPRRNGTLWFATEDGVRLWFKSREINARMERERRSKRVRSAVKR